jgi:hypothetical protein
MQTGHAIVAICAAVGGIAFLAAACLTNGCTQPEPPTGVVPTGFRLCPECLTTRAAVEHRDGSATCDCGTHIPAPEVTP